MKTHSDSSPQIHSSTSCPYGDKTQKDIGSSSAPLIPPFSPLNKIPSSLRDAIAEEALLANNEYLSEFVEKYNICPFARAARNDGSAVQIVHYYDGKNTDFLVQLMENVINTPSQVVTQVIFPMIEVEPHAWRNYCHALTQLAHSQARQGTTLAVAALHPLCEYTTDSANSLLTLFRRTPDPTIQWVRLDALSRIYENRTSGSEFVAPEDIPRLLSTPNANIDLYERISQANRTCAERIGVAKMEAQLASLRNRLINKYETLVSSHTTI